MSLQQRALQPAESFLEATQLQVRLPKSTFGSYLTTWLRLCNSESLVISDDIIRESLIIHCWKEAIPRFLRNQMAPPFHDDAPWVIRQAGKVGPDFNELFAWLLHECSGAENEKYWADTLPEGLFEAVQDPSLMSSFRPGWIRQMLNMASLDLSSQWQSWIVRKGFETFAFDNDGLRIFEMNVKMQIDPWATQVGRHVWRI